MEIAGHERVVGCAEPALARGIRLKVCRVVRLPNAVDFARQAQFIGRIGAVRRRARADAAIDERPPVRLDERPIISVSGLAHRAMKFVRDPRALAHFLLAEPKVCDHFKAAAPVLACFAAVARECHPRIAGEDDAIALFPRHVKQIVDGAIERFIALLKRRQLA